MSGLKHHLSLTLRWAFSPVSYHITLNIFLLEPDSCTVHSILLVVYEYCGLHRESDLSQFYWMEQNCLFHCFSWILSEVSFTILFFSLPFEGAFLSLENCVEIEKLIHCCVSQEDSTLCNSYHPELSLDTLHSREILVPHSMHSREEK